MAKAKKRNPADLTKRNNDARKKEISALRIELRKVERLFNIELGAHGNITDALTRASSAAACALVSITERLDKLDARVKTIEGVAADLMTFAGDEATRNDQARRPRRRG